MVHLTKLLRHGGPTPYYPNPRLMVGTGKEVLNKESHYYPLLPVHAVTIGGCIICALYMGRSLIFGSDVNFNKEGKAFPWMQRSDQHQYKFFSFNMKYKDIEDQPTDKGLKLYREKAKVALTSKDYYNLSHGIKEEKENEEEE
ncbi:cytochrome c oxidase subunit NDUFA4-like [Mizuhopecten yessoensis]|uniref:cytochrome c oxidase subunit NDUFA4-like n=1 Tax=Mizuhopecten yessoensis TaxID=6573 RepID=UPI000B45A810|nr:cytochrome c oxidase subunit NDUFA4-like [Mizuhopecten yessoensis]